MTEFRIEGVGGAHDGELLYWTNDWEHPPLLHLDPPLSFEAGDGVRLSTTYNNQTNKTIRFGLLSSDEMQFMFYMYFTGEISTDVDATIEIPEGYFLAQNYPNPFNPSTTISYRLPEASQVEIKVFDVLGQVVDVLVDGYLNAGTHEVTWHAGMLPSGVYFVRMKASTHIQTRTAYLIK